MAGRTRPERDEVAVRRFVEHLALALVEWGFPRMPARVLVTLMAADDEALTAHELGERLGVSPAAISGAVRYLMHVGLLAREPVRGSRRDQYRLPDDAWYVASATKRSLFTGVADLAEEGVAAVGTETSAAGQRIAEMRDFFRFLDSEMEGMLDKWHASRERARGRPNRLPVSD